MQQDNVKNLFEGHGLDQTSLYCASVIIATLINQRFTDVDTLKNLDKSYFKDFTPVIADAAYNLAKMWSQETGSTTTGSGEATRFAYSR